MNCIKYLEMSDHVAAVCCAAYFQLRQLRLVARSPTVDAVVARPSFHYMSPRLL